MNQKSNYHNKRIGIMGGTFDPIHIGHLAIAQEAFDYKKLDKVFFIPAGFPPHKSRNITDGKTRLKLVELATKDNEKFIALDYEVKKQSKSYSMETIMYLKNIYRDCDFFFIMGEDSFKDIESWYSYEEFLQEVKILVAKRSFSDFKKLREKIDRLCNEGYDIDEIPTSFLDISSTNIRKKFKNKENPKYYLQQDVYNYIKKEGLYDWL